MLLLSINFSFLMARDQLLYNILNATVWGQNVMYVHVFFFWDAQPQVTCKSTNKQKTTCNRAQFQFHCSKIFYCIVSFKPPLWFLEEDKLYSVSCLSTASCFFIRLKTRKPSAPVGVSQDAHLWRTAHSSSINNQTLFFHILLRNYRW